MTWSLWVLAAVAVVWAQRAVRARRRERYWSSRFPAQEGGIVNGAEPCTFAAEGSRAILLMHGYNDTPQSMLPLARALQAAGWTVRVPLLPGHGRSLEAFDDWTAEQLLAHVREEYASLRATHATVVVGGLSMGGAVACWLAAESEPAGVLLYAPMLFVPSQMQVVVSTARLWSLFTKYISGGGRRSIRDPNAQERMIAYGCSTRRSLEALEHIAKGTAVRLGFVHAPTLVIQSEDDNRLPREQSTHALARLGARDRTIVWTRGAGHVITVDYGCEALAATTVEWLKARY